MHNPWFCLFILLSAGCVVTTSTTPPLALPELFSASGEAARENQWWQQFQDPLLNEYIATAFRENFTLRSAKERILAAEARARLEGAPLLPAVTMQGDASSRKSDRQTVENFSLGLAASYEIDLWGRLHANRNAAITDVLISREDLNTAALSVAAETALVWFSCIENGLQLQLIHSQQEINKKNEEIIEIRVRAGQAQMADLIQQRQLIQANDANFSEQSARGRLLFHRLHLLIGQVPHAEKKEATLSLPQLPPLPETGVPFELLQRRPDVHAAWLALAAADQRTSAAIANRLPRLSLRADLETGGSRTSDLFTNWLTALAANLLGPIIDGGSRRAEVEIRRATARQKYALWGETILNALKETEDSLVQEEALKKRRQHLSQQLELAQNSVELVSRRYQQGAENYQRVLQTILSQQTLERDLINIQFQLLANRVTLYRALSGGLQEELVQTQTRDNE